MPDAGVPDVDAEPPSPDAMTEEPPHDEGCDCSTGGGPAPGTFVLIALIALVSRARPRRAR
jgi:MYXO-CTERM domain-containing protein